MVKAVVGSGVVVGGRVTVEAKEVVVEVEVEDRAAASKRKGAAGQRNYPLCWDSARKARATRCYR